MKELKGFLQFSLGLLAMAPVVYFSLLLSFSFFKIDNLPILYRTNTYYQWPGGDTFHKLRWLETKPAVDLMILGSSKAYRGVDCNWLSNRGLETINLGTTGQDLCTSLAIAKSHYSELGVKKIVVELSAISFESSGLEARINLLSNVPERDLSYRLLNFRDPRLINVYMASSMNFSLSPLFDKKGTLECGSVLTEGSIEKNIDFSEYGLSFEPRPNEVVCLKEFLDYFSNVDCDLSFVTFPEPSEIGSTEHQEMRRIITPILENFKASYIDWYHHPKFETSRHFLDHIHLNEEGARVLSNLLFENFKDDKNEK